MKVSDLEGEALDDAVALALGWERSPSGWIEPTADGCGHTTFSFKPSTDWRVGGPLIERERINITSQDGAWCAGYNLRYHARMVHDGGGHFDDMGEFEMDHQQNGNTPLQAAMRCFVAMVKNLPDANQKR